MCCVQFYETGLVDKKLWPFGEDLRKRFEQTRVSLLARHTDSIIFHMHRVAEFIYLCVLESKSTCSAFPPSSFSFHVLYWGEGMWCVNLLQELHGYVRRMLTVRVLAGPDAAAEGDGSQEAAGDQ